MKSDILTHQEILELHAAIMSAEMSGMRLGLLAHMDSDFAASLKHATSPTEQVLSDLSALNVAGILADSSVPLEVWLGNAVAMAGNRRETEVFRQMLDVVRRKSLGDARKQALEAAAKATATVAQLQAVGSSLARISLTVLARAGIWGAFPWAEKLQLRAQLVLQLHELGVSPGDIENAEATLRSLVRYRLAWKTIDVAKAAAAEPSVDFEAKLRSLFDFDAQIMPSASQLRQQFESRMSPEVAAHLLELEHFERTGEVRNPDILDRDSR